VLGDVAAAATEVGIEPGSPEASELARRLAEVELGSAQGTGTVNGR
jgi:hypothetical protein